MRQHFVEDGRKRLESDQEFQRQCLEQSRTIRSKYAPWLAEAKGFDWLRLWWRMRLELRRVRPSDASLW